MKIIEINEEGIAIEREMTEEEEREFTRPLPKEIIIEQLKEELAATDYKAIKYAEGWYSDEEYAQIKEQRQNLRDRINELEDE